MAIDDQYLSIKDVAKRLNVSRRTIFLWIKKEIMPPPLRRGRKFVRFLLRDIEKFERSLM